MLKNISIV